MAEAVHALELAMWVAVAAFVVAAVVRATKLVVRRDRAALRQGVARPLVDGARVDAAIHGVYSASSDDLTAALQADATARGQRSSLVVDVDPLQGPVLPVVPRGGRP